MNRTVYTARAAVLITLGLLFAYAGDYCTSKITPKPSVVGAYKEVWYYGTLGLVKGTFFVGVIATLVGALALIVNIWKVYRTLRARQSHPAGRDFIAS
jgi:uncharacterized membrane protein